MVTLSALLVQAATTGQTKYDSTVLIAAISTIGAILTGIIGIVTAMLSRKLDGLHTQNSIQSTQMAGQAVQIRGQSQQLGEITLKVNGQLDRAMAKIDGLQKALGLIGFQNPEQTATEILDLHAKLDAALADLTALRGTLNHTEDPPA